ncbi:hypothetical protein QBC35DRAFT_38858 [Podospora australis]|uniref:ATPase synthesis protein 25 n=1 Tax=Podospora australis TaxID=1536484 RepID=A0AAN7AGB1_9PEZI|nr:hypothetical protein QBC35DRAFT_38858 [Podospora australis]
MSAFVAAGSPAIRAARCSACSLSALRLFVGNITEVRIAQAASVSASRTRRFAPTTAASFHSTPRVLSGPAIVEFAENKNQSPQPQDEHSPRQTQRDEEGKDGQEFSPAEPNAEADNSDVPWYLRVEPPRHPTLMHDPQPLPDIPEGAPNLTEPLLKYASDELGLDDLEFVDLREMDPPPALGPDTLMIFGTARSERHLHVSADRLVRWLRGQGIAAKADGLLGRNELKTKLKRIARKAKLLGTSGVTRGGDDGITTGWICVNLGPVGGSRKETTMRDEEGRVSGFGVARTGTTLVVQILTEGRRQELDLEGFWREQLEQSIENNNREPLRRLPRALDAYRPGRKRTMPTHQHGATEEPEATV